MICVQNIYEIKYPRTEEKCSRLSIKKNSIAEKIELKTIRDHGTIKFVPEKKKFSQVENEMVYDIKSDENGKVDIIVRCEYCMVHINIVVYVNLIYIYIYVHMICV